MKKQTILKILALVLLVSILIVYLCTCANKVKFDKDSPECYYEDNTYVYYDDLAQPTGWVLEPSKDMVKKVDIGVWTYPWMFPIYATNEEPANFVIENFNRSAEHFMDIAAYVRSDLEIKSCYDVAYQKVLFEYNKNVSEDEKCLSEYPEGTTFKDIAGDNIVEGSSSSYSHYGMFICIYPGIEYLRHYFHVYEDRFGQLYLSADDESYNEILYKLPITIPNKTEDGSSSQTTNN